MEYQLQLQQMEYFHINIVEIMKNFTILLMNIFLFTERHFGPDLVMRKVSRNQMGAYLCIASNDVPPAVSKRVILNVNCK